MRRRTATPPQRRGKAGHGLLWHPSEPILALRMNRSLDIRRCAALLATVSFFALPAETLIADVHDGDALGFQTLTGAATGAESGAPEVPSPVQEHSQHVDHCAHGHGPALPSHPSIAIALREIRESREPGGLRWDSLTLTPPLRPPIPA